MAWSAGTFSRTITGGWATDKATTPAITAARHDVNDDDLATGINACLHKGGQNSPTAHINWGGYKITNLADAVDAQDAVNKQSLSSLTDYVSGAQIADDAIDSEHYTDGSIDTAHIAADAIDGTLIADDAIDSEHYTDGSIDLAHLAADCVDGTKIANDAIDSEHYTDGSIDAVHIASSAVTTAKIAADAVTGAKIADDAVGSEHIEDLTADLVFDNGYGPKLGTAAIFSSGTTFARFLNIANGGGSLTHTLPEAADWIGRGILFLNAAGAANTIDVTGADSIVGNGSSGTIISVNDDSVALFFAMTDDIWVVIKP